MIRAVVDSLKGGSQLSVLEVVLSRVMVPVVVREVAARDFDADPMTLCETIGRRAETYMEFGYRDGVEQLLGVQTVAMSRPDHSVADFDGRTVIRIFIDETHEEVRIRTGGRGVENRLRITDDFDVFIQCLCAIDQDIVSVLQLASIGRLGVEHS